MKLTWADILPLITRYGIEFAYKFWANSQNDAPPTEESWAELRSLAKPYDQYILEAQQRADVAKGADWPQPTPPVT